MLGSRDSGDAYKPSGPDVGGGPGAPIQAPEDDDIPF
jgi:hypothetical protein